MFLSNHLLAGGSSSPGILVCDSADFDGTNDYMTRGADLTGSADGKQGTFSAWIRLDAGDGVLQSILTSAATVGGGGANLRHAIRRLADNTFQAFMVDTANTKILSISTTGTYLAGGTWLHLLASWDLATAGARFIYMNDVADLAVTTFTDATIDYTLADWAVGSAPNGNNKLDGCLAELWFTTTYMDISLAYNRRKFISSSGKPVFLGATGNVPTGTAPLVYHHIDNGEAVANFATNRGSGGDFSITGTLATGSDSPSD